MEVILWTFVQEESSVAFNPWYVMIVVVWGVDAGWAIIRHNQSYSEEMRSVIVMDYNESRGCSCGEGAGRSPQT